MMSNKVTICWNVTSCSRVVREFRHLPSSEDKENSFYHLTRWNLDACVCLAEKRNLSTAGELYPRKETLETLHNSREPIFGNVRCSHL